MSKKQANMADQVRRVMKAEMKAGRTLYRIAKDSGLATSVLTQFQDGGDLRLGTTATKLCAVLGLQLSKVKPAVKSKKSRRR